jgi:signal transduction histidine kinase
VGRRATRSRTEPLPGEAALLDALIARAPHAIAVTEGPAHVLRRANPAFRQLLGLAEGDGLDRPYAELFPEPVGEGLLPLLDRVRAACESEADCEIARRRAVGEDVMWSCTAWPLQDRAGAVTGLVVEVRDHTKGAEQVRHLQQMAGEIRQINERLLRSALQEQEWAEKAEAAARAKSDFLAMMSHELRTPLSGIVGYTEVLLSEMIGSINPKQRDGLKRINACSGHLLEMIDDILSYARLEAQRVQVRSRVVNLCEVAHEAAAVIEPLAAEKRLDFRIEVPERALLLETDPHWVRQILLNLLGNAVKFTEAGDVALELREESPGIGLRVRDTGIGISAEDLERVFEPFVQGEDVMTRRFGGAGLGLPISRSLAAVLGGTLTVESAPGRGSVFALHLPHDAPARMAHRSPPPPGPT